MQELTPYFNMLTRVSKIIETLPRRAATVAVNFSKQRFTAQNWVDSNTLPWKQRKPIRGESRKRAGRAILVDTGRLRRSIRTIRVTTNSATIGTDVPYAQAHNEGFRGNVRQSVRAHTRANKPVKAHTRVINQNIPKRRFMGNSAVLEQQLQRMMTSEIIKAIKG